MYARFFQPLPVNPCTVATTGMPHRRRSNDHALDAFFEPALHRTQIADAAAELYGNRHRFEDRLDRLTIDWLAGEFLT